MNPTQSLRIQLVDARGRPVGQKDVFFSIGFFLNGAYRYAFRTGGTDPEGRVETCYADMERARKINLAYQPMDYKTSLEECDPEVEIRLPGADEMQAAWRAVHMYEASELFEDAERWRTSANGRIRAGSIRVQLGFGKTDAAFPCEPS